MSLALLTALSAMRDERVPFHVDRRSSFEVVVSITHVHRRTAMRHALQLAAVVAGDDGLAVDDVCVEWRAGVAYVVAFELVSSDAASSFERMLRSA